MKFEYNDEAKTILYRVPIETSIPIPLQVEEIYGINIRDYSFIKAKDTVTTVTFGEGNQLQRISNYAFYQCAKIVSIDLTQCTNLKSISEYAFSGCSALTTFVFPNDTVTTLGQRVFEYCTSLKSIYMPASISTIGIRLFAGCGKLKSCVFDPESKLKTLTWGAFFECYELASFTVPKSFENLYNTINNCIKLLNIFCDPLNKKFDSVEGVLYSKDHKTVYNMPTGRTGSYTVLNDVVSISSYSFNTAKLTEVILPATLEYIGDYAFSATKFTSINIPESVNEIAYKAFAVSSITSIVLPTNVSKLGDEIFSGCKQLQTVKMPTTFDTIGGGIFAGCPNVDIIFDENSDFKVMEQELVYNKAGNKIVLFLGQRDQITVYDNVTEIGNKVFFSCKTLKTIIFDGTSTLEKIGSYTFSESGLTEIVIPDSVTEICDNAFSKCEDLVNVTLSEKLGFIRKFAFSGCSSLKNVTFSGQTDCEIHQNAFENCVALDTVQLYTFITLIKEYAFKNCNSLTVLSIPPSIKTIESFAFDNSGLNTLTIDSESMIESLPSYLCSNCRNLVTIQIPDTVKSLGTYCFADTKIKSFTVPKGVVNISSYCFNGCTELTQFNIEKDCSLSRIQLHAFSGCINFEKINCQSDSFSLISGALYSEDRSRLIIVPQKLKSTFFSFPDELKVISEGALLDCIYIYHIMITSGSVTEIENNVFEGCVNLVTINIPASVTKIGKDAFKGCNNLKCGLYIENETKEFKDMLSKALLPEVCFESCEHMCTPNRMHYTTLPSLKFTLLCLIINL